MDRIVSKEHARIERRGESHVLIDLGSLNGTWVNGTRVSQHTLKDGDRVQLGGSILRFESPQTTMPRGRVNHAIGALETLAEESAKQSEAELRKKVGEESTLVVCKCPILTFY